MHNSSQTSGYYFSGIIFLILLLVPTSLLTQVEDWDTDQDAMPNGFENYRGLNVNDPKDAWLDPDGDGISNLYEYFLGTDPQDKSQPRFLQLRPNETLSEAIQNAGRGVVLQIPAGTYPLNYQPGSQAEPPRLLLQGGWNAVFSERDYCRYPTIIQGENQGGLFNFLIAAGNSASLILDGFTLTGGKAGAIQFTGYLSKVQLLLANCRLIGNEAHRASAILNFADGAGSSLISDFILINTLVAGNQGTAIRSEQYATRTNFKCLHSIVALNGAAVNDQQPYTSGYGLDIYPLSDSAFNLQITNSILWGNANQEVEVHHLSSQLVKAQINNNLFGFLPEGIRSTLFSHPSNRSLDPLLEQKEGVLFSINAQSPARQAGIDLGFFPEEQPNIGSTFCEALLSPIVNKVEDSENVWLVFPNPSRSGLTLRGHIPIPGNLQLILYNSLGQIVQLENHRSLANGSVNLWLTTANLDRGLYFLEIRFGDQKTGKRLLLVR